MNLTAGCRLVVVAEETLARVSLGQDDATVEILAAAENDDTLAQYFARLAARSAARTPGAPLVLGVQADVLPPGVLPRLEYLADAVVFAAHGQPVALTLRQKPGFVRRPVTVGADGSYTPIHVAPASKSAAQAALPESTFSLHANERQAAARAAVVLPHVREAQNSIERPVLAYDYDPEEEIDLDE